MTSAWLWGSGISTIALGGGLLWLSNSRRSQEEQATVCDAATIRAGQLRVLSAEELFLRTGSRPRLDRIAELAGLDRTNWSSAGQPLLEHYAAFVQRLPASESHHHAHPGGLLSHALECAEIALLARRGLMLPRGATPEEINLRRHRWTYAVLVAALLHDIAKPLTDQKITLFGADANAGREWQPLAGDMSAFRASYYRVEFREPAERDYSQHKRLPVVLMQRLAPQPALAWISEDAALMRELVAYLSGEAADGVLTELVTAADRESVRLNLLAGPRTRFATARSVPLIERLTEALRRLLQDGAALPLNRRGAVGWVWDGSLWVAAKTIADQVRIYLDANEERLVGAAGIPTINTRLFDTWQEYGVILPNPATGLAVWNISVIGADDEPLHKGVLQVLRFPLDKLYRDSSDYPKTFGGRIESAGPGQETSSFSTPISNVPRNEPDVAVINVASMSHVETTQADSALTATAGEEPLESHVSNEDALDPADTANASESDDGTGAQRTATPRMRLLVKPGALPEPLRPKQKSGEPLVPAESKLPPIPGEATDVKPAKPLAQLFMNWLAQGISDGSVTYNTATSIAHFVTEGMLLVSPKVFQQFEELVKSGVVTDSDGLLTDKTWKEVQNAVAKSGWLYASQPGNRHAVTYDVLAQGKAMRATVTGFLVQTPERWLSPLPRPNPYLLARPRAPKATAALSELSDS
jgi:integrating conjugative element relaxase (TIGR03760 family)